MVDENGAIWIQNSNYFPNRNGNTPRYIVLHSTAGGSSAQGIANYFASTQGGSNPVSSHYIVGTDGAIVQCIAESDGAYGNGYISGLSGTSGDGIGNGYHDSWWGNDGNPNNISISIEHVKSATDNSNTLTAEQQQASFTLIQHICQRHNIPMRKADASGGITGHYSIDPVNKALCPGPYPWQELWKFLGETNTVTTLEGFPMKSQLADTSEVDRYYICVATSIAAALEWLTKTPFDGATIKDVIYGVAYQGTTAPQAYIDYCAKQGVRLSPINGDNIILVQSAKQQLVQSKPVLLTEVDPYLPTSSGATHMVVAYACDASSITVMDPFIGKQVTKTDQQWQSDLRFNQIWTMERIEDVVLTIDQASNYFTETAKDTRWHCTKTNQDIAYGILTYYRTCTNAGLNGLSMFGLPLNGEQPVPGYKSVVMQRFERGGIAYDPAHEMDSVPGITGPCYPVHLDKLLQLATVPVSVSSALSTLHAAQSTAVTLQAAIGALNTGIQSAISNLEKPS